MAAWQRRLASGRSGINGIQTYDEVFVTYDADYKVLNRTHLGSHASPIHVGYGFSYTPNLFLENFFNQTVTYMIGACEGTPGRRQARWVEDNCVFSEPREFDFVPRFDPNDFGWGW